MTSQRRIFVPARGQYDNIGDILLRRQLLDWLRGNGRLHVYLGASPPGYDAGLRLKDGDVTYRSFWRWYSAGIVDALRRRASYVYKPGEIQLTLVGMKEHLAMLPLVALVRAGGGFVGRVGVGSRNFSPLPRALITPSILLSNVSWWRDAETARYLRHGSVIPDLAFGEQPTATSGDRDLLVVSMRSDPAHPGLPSDEWIEAVRRVASDRGLAIVTVAQVTRDHERSLALAQMLGGEATGWDGVDHLAHEERLRTLYRRAALTISDRLHVLIAAATEGSVPAAPLTGGSGKIARHFAAAGVHDVAFRTRGATAADVAAQLGAVLDRGDDIRDRVAGARADLDAARVRLHAAMTAAG